MFYKLFFLHDDFLGAWYTEDSPEIFMEMKADNSVDDVDTVSNRQLPHLVNGSLEDWKRT